MTTEETRPLAVGADDVPEYLPISVRTWRRMDAAGAIPRAVRIGARKVWRLQELRDWIAAGAPKREEWERRNSGRGLAR